MSRIYRTLGTVAMTPEGEYNSSTYYEKLNVVTYNGSSYVALQNTQGNLPTNTTYWQLLAQKGSKTYDTVAEMKADTDLNSGMCAQTLGYYSANDGGGATYKITDEESESEYQEELDNDLYANLIIINDTINVKQLGAYGDGTHDDTTAIQNSINYLNKGKIFIPQGSYICSSPIQCKVNVDIEGDFDYLYTQSSNLGLLFNNTDGLVDSYRNKIKNIIIQNKYTSKTKSGISTNGGIVDQCTIRGFRNGIDCAYHSVTAIKCQINQNYFGIINPNDSRIINCTFASNENHAINMQTGASDNIISNNKIEWNGANGINGYNSDNNTITGNIVDRNSSQGISFTGGNNITIVGNMLRRNGVTSTSTDQAQFRFDNMNKLIVSGNTTAKGNSEDDGTGTVVPAYAIRIMNSTDVLTIGNNFNGGTNSNPISLSSNTNLQMFDMGYDIPSMLKGTMVSGTANSSNSVVLSIPGTKAASGKVPEFQKVNYQVRRTDNGSYEAGEFILSNFRVWGSATSTSAKCSISSILTNLSIAVSYNLDTEKYDITFTNADASHSFNINLTPINI